MLAAERSSGVWGRGTIGEHEGVPDQLGDDGGDVVDAEVEEGGGGVVLFDVGDGGDEGRQGGEERERELHREGGSRY